MKKIICAGLLSILLLPSISHALGIEVAVGGWSQSPEGTMANDSYLGADQIDLESDANYEDEFRGTARVKIDMPLFIPNIYLMATPMEFEGAGSKSLFSFGGETFDGDFDSTMTLDHYDIALYYGVPLLETVSLNKLNVEFGINIRFIDYSAKLTQDTPVSQVESISESLVVPMGYVGVQFRPFEWLGLEVEGRLISYSDNSYVDYIGRVKYHPFNTPFRSFYLAGGYRFQDIEIDENDIYVKVTFSGPFAETGIDF